MLKIAFYKGPGKLFDKLIRWWTGGPYSHTELIFSDGISYSSSPRELKARYKDILYIPEHWDFVDVYLPPGYEKEVRLWCDSKVGAGYDWMGIFLSQVLPLDVHSRRRYFCSEIVVRALQQAGRFRGYHSNEIHPNLLWHILHRPHVLPG